MVHLVPISLAHAARVQVLAADERIAATSNVPHPYPIDGAITWIRYTLDQRRQGREFSYAIENEAGEVVGVCGVVNVGGKPRRGDLGYWIGVDYWGRGYATAAARELVRLTFEEHGLEEIHSSCLIRNAASARVLERAGFRHIGYGTLPNAKWSPKDRFKMWELTLEDWLAGRAEAT